MSDAAAEARKVAARINKEMDIPDLVVTGAEARALRPGWLTTGILALDVALGGGWPTNRWSEIIGNESAGKTLVALLTIAANQRRDPDWVAVWVAAEDFDAGWAEQIGVDLDRLILVDTNVMQDAYHVTLEYLRSMAVDLIVIDSLPALVPIQEDEANMDEHQVSLGARLTGKFFRKARSAGKRSIVEFQRPVTGLMINQWRDKVGGFSPVPGHTPQTTPGGRGKNFHYFTRVELTRTDWLKQGKEKVGQVVKAIVVKNKAAAPQKQANFDFYFEPYEGFLPGEVDYTKDVFNTAVAKGVVQKAGGWYTHGDLRAQGRENFVQLLDENPEAVDVIYSETIHRMRPDPDDVAEVLDEPEPVEEPVKKKVVKRRKKPS